jgi:hypothetical protein
MKNEAFQMWAAMSTIVAVSFVIGWTALSRALISRNPSAPSSRCWTLAALLVGPLFAMLELWTVAAAFGRSWAPLPWIIAAGGVVSLAIIPIMAAKTRRLAPERRRRALTNFAVIIVACTLIAELGVYVQPSWQPWISAAAAVFVVILGAQKRLVSRD